MKFEHNMGEGILNWNRGERVSDRYGAVTLSPDPDSEASALNVSEFYIQGRKGKLVATVLEVRASEHIGDMFHGFFPGGAELGMEIELGSGRVFIEQDQGATVLGLIPDDARETFWLDPKALYKAHEQRVRITFVEAP